MDVQQALNALSARYSQVQESILTLAKWREKVQEDLALIKQQLKDVTTVAMARQHLLARIGDEHKSLQEQLRSLSRKVDELTRENAKLKEQVNLVASWRPAETIGSRPPGTF